MIRFLFSIEAGKTSTNCRSTSVPSRWHRGLALAKALQETTKRIALYPRLGQRDPELSRVLRRLIHHRICRDYVFFYAMASDKVN